MKEDKKYIIDEPYLKSPLRSGTEITITFIAWLVWAYLLMPMITLLLWVLGVRIVFVEQVMLKGIEGIASVILYYLAGIAAIGLVLRLWSFYNKKRFAGKDRRRKALSISNEELATHFNVSVESLRKAKNAQMVTVEFEDNKIALIKVD